MTTALSAILAATLTLSLTNASQYRYMNPTNVTLEGIGLKTNAYGATMLRAEDLEFLKEAYAERYMALCHATNIVEDTWRKIEEERRIYAVTNWATYCYSPSYSWFDWTFSRRQQGRYGLEARFVSDTFAFPDDWYWQTGTNWYVNSQPTVFVESLKYATLLPFTNELAQYAVDASRLSDRRILSGPLYLSNLVGLYTNIVVDNGCKICGRAMPCDLFGTKRIQTNENQNLSEIATVITTPYTYTYGGVTYSSSYISGCTYRSGTRNASEYTNATDVTDFTWFLYQANRYTYKHYSVRINDNYSPAKYHLVNYGETQRYSNSDYMHATIGNARISSSSLIAATNYTGTVDAFVLVRIAIVQGDNYSGDIASGLSRTATTNHFVLTANTTATHIGGGTWELDYDIVKEVQTELPEYGDYVEWAKRAEYPTSDKFAPVPSDTNEFWKAEYSVNHYRSVRVNVDGLYTFFTYKPTFNARAWWNN